MANMGRPTWVLSSSNGPHVGPMDLAIGEGLVNICNRFVSPVLADGVALLVTGASTGTLTSKFGTST